MPFDLPIIVEHKISKMDTWQLFFSFLLLKQLHHEERDASYCLSPSHVFTDGYVYYFGYTMVILSRSSEYVELRYRHLTPPINAHRIAADSYFAQLAQYIGMVLVGLIIPVLLKNKNNGYNKLSQGRNNEALHMVTKEVQLARWIHANIRDTGACE